MIPDSFLIAAVPIIGGWIWRTESRLNRMDGLIAKIDKLVDLLLEDRLDQSKKGGNTQEFGDRSRRLEREPGLGVRHNYNQRD